MLEIVQEILQAEQKAEDVARAARERASTLRSDAEKNVQEQLTKARNDAAGLVQQRLTDARAEQERQYRAVVEQTNSVTATFPEDHRDAVDDLISKIVLFICEPEFLRE